MEKQKGSAVVGYEQNGELLVSEAWLLDGMAEDSVSC